MLSILFDERWRARASAGGTRLFWIFLSLGLLGMSADVLAHAVAEGDKGYIQEITGVNLIAFMYLGAKHMVTGYDHLLFLLGVIFFLYRMQHIAIYVSLFAVGHSLTMLLGVYFDIGINSYVIDAIIGLSVVYKAAGLASSPIPRQRRLSSACSTALACLPRLSNTTFPRTAWCRICSRSTSAWKWVS